MSTPPPTETPAPLSTQAQVQADIEVRLRMSLGWSKSRDALCEEAAIEIANLRVRNEALTAEHADRLRSMEQARDGAMEMVKHYVTRAEAAESTIARHVAALQEIGRGVEEDQATIARLREELALAADRFDMCATVAVGGGKYSQECYRRWANACRAALSSPLSQANKRHRARHDTEGREG